MADHLSPERRSRNMAAIHSGDTKPEMTVRRMVFAMGYRYRLHCSELPGKPDLVFPSKKKVIFVHGCFWHCHNRCNRSNIPKTHSAYWRAKLDGNVQRDKRNHRRLKEMGWKVFTVWECQLKDPERLVGRVNAFLQI